ncbi:MAG: hypothetical protein IKO84_11465 [Butyrivibrio sp.]|nr:hypothetical protein [Butyrivibrio sp.]
MAENKVLMDTNVFTEITTGIKGNASNCVFSDELLRKTDIWEDTATGRKMNELLKSFYKMSDAYRLEAAESLPRALLTLRDSMVGVDKNLSESIDVEKAIEPKRNIPEVI